VVGGTTDSLRNQPCCLGFGQLTCVVPIENKNLASSCHSCNLFTLFATISRAYSYCNSAFVGLDVTIIDEC